MKIHRRWVIASGLYFVVTFALLLTVGCEKIPDHIMNSPPATQEFVPESEADGPLTPAPSLPRRQPPRDLIAGDNRTNVHVTKFRPESDERLENTAAEALARLGAPSVPTLISQLQTDDTSARWRAADTLARMGPAAVDAAEPLVERLEDADEHPEVKLACARAIGQMGAALWPDPPQLVLPVPSLEPLPEVTDEAFSNVELAAIRLRQQTRRVEYDELAERRQREYYEQQQEFQRRRAVAQRAVKALAELAQSNS